MKKTAASSTTPRRGWAVPARARSAHYFVNATSLCGAWMYTGELEDDKHEHPDNCISCMRARKSLVDGDAQ